MCHIYRLVLRLFNLKSFNKGLKIPGTPCPHTAMGFSGEWSHQLCPAVSQMLLMGIPGAGSEASHGFPAQRCSLTAWMNWCTCLVPGGKDVMSPSKSSQSSIKIPSHPHIRRRWFLYSPGWIPHPEIALVFCAQSAGVSINRTRHKLLFEAIYYSLPFSVVEITGKAVGGVLIRHSDSGYLQGCLCFFFFYLHADVTAEQSKGTQACSKTQVSS